MCLAKIFSGFSPFLQEFCVFLNHFAPPSSSVSPPNFFIFFFIFPVPPAVSFPSLPPFPLLPKCPTLFSGPFYLCEGSSLSLLFCLCTRHNRFFYHFSSSVFPAFFILCGSASLLSPPPSICLQHQCFHFLPPPSQPPLTVHFSFCHSSPLVFSLLCLFPPTFSLRVTISLCHYISFSLCLVSIGPQ